MRKLWYRVKQFFINIKEVSRLNETVSELKKQSEYHLEIIRGQQNKLDYLERTIKAVETKYEEMEKFMETAKGIVKETQNRAEIVKKQKWLTGYPDETGKKV